jgi:hypothetical protein
MGKYARVFLGCEAIEAITEYITKTAKAAAGFSKYCGDSKRLKQKAKAIAKWCLQHHFPWGSKKSETGEETAKSEIESQKAQKQAERLKRIRIVVSELTQTKEMPNTIRGMAQAIAQRAKVSMETLYANKELWHPEFTETSQETSNSATRAEIRPEEASKTNLTQQAESKIERDVTEKPLYKAFAFSETPLRGQELPKIAPVDFQGLTDLPKSSSKTREPMWVETHGRLSLPKNESAKPSMSPNAQTPSTRTANADCLRPYEMLKNQDISLFESRIGYLRALLATPILRRGKSASELKSLQAELERLESARQKHSDLEPM